MIIKFNIKTQSKKKFIYSFILNKKRFIVIYNEGYLQKHIILMPISITPLNLNNRSIIFLNSNSINNKKVNQFFRLFYKNMIYNENTFSRKIILKGLGYKLEKINSNFLKINVNFSHPFFIYVPKVINIVSLESQNLHITSNDKKTIDFFSNLFSQMKKPNLYKNKGIFFFNLLKTT